MKHCLDCGKEKSKKGKYCKVCGYKHRTRPTGLKYTLHKINPTSFKKGLTPWNKGVVSKIFSGNTIDGLHEWVYRVLGSPNTCEFCGKSVNLEWSNKSGTYKQEISDWQRLCKKCHNRYDFEKFGDRKEFYT